MLLDALKKAALEKKSATQVSSDQSDSDSLVDGNDEQRGEVSGNLSPEVNSIPSVETLNLNVSAANESQPLIKGGNDEIINDESLELEFGEACSIENEENDGVDENEESSLQELENIKIEVPAKPSFVASDQGQIETEIEAETEVQTQVSGPLPVDQAAIDAMIEGAYGVSESESKSVAASSIGSEMPAKGGARSSDKKPKIESSVSAEALDQLINQTESERKREHRRKVGLVAALFLVALILGVIYYFIAKVSEDMTGMSMAPVADNIPSTETPIDSKAVSDIFKEPSVTFQKPSVVAKKTSSVEEPTMTKTGAAQTMTEEIAVATANKKNDITSKKIATKEVSRDKKVFGRDQIKSVVNRKKRNNTIQVRPLKNTRISARSGDNGSELKPSKKAVTELSLETTLQQAYLAYHADQLNEAKSLYQSALDRDIQNRDALLGLSAIATKLGEYDVALSHYSSLLTVNPLDDLAQAGILQISFQNGFANAETKIKLLIDQTPQSGFLRFALGNVYVNRDHWKPALYQFRHAVNLDPINADFSYNLAVSYDQLGNHKEALLSYQRALSLSWNKSVSFSRDRLRKRMTELSEIGAIKPVGVAEDE